MTWLHYALLSAVAASGTAIFTKLGVERVPSNAATAFRTAIVLIVACAIAIRTGETRSLIAASPRSLLFLTLSAVATAVSWLAYFRALQLGPVSSVAPIDKLSIVFTVTFSALFLAEALSWKVMLGTALIAVGAIITVL